MRSFPNLPISALALAGTTTTTVVLASSSSSITSSSSSSSSSFPSDRSLWHNSIEDVNRAKKFQELQQHFAPDPTDILADLDSYAKLWIEQPKLKISVGKRGSCVWSECGIDETDDAYMGDNRDGDEKWYQYRTQGFCANAAYSLYGIKKGELSWGGCSKGHFINSFFTYGGADNLLKAVGEVPVTYYDYYASANDDAANAANDDDGNSYQASNNNCVEIDSYGDGAQNQGDERQRHLGSGSGDGGYSSTLGCSADGKYVIASFQGDSCDGNYFLEDIDTFEDYNTQHEHVGCQRIYSSHKDSSDDYNSAIHKLLSNSWTCDIKLYPDACPDPYGTKARYEYALRTAENGGNPMRAYQHEMLKTPLRRVSWALLMLTVLVLVATYAIKNTKRILTRGGGVKGFGLCVKEDTMNGWKSTKEGAVALATKSRAQHKARSIEKKRRKNGGRDAEQHQDRTADDNGSFQEMTRVNHKEEDGGIEIGPSPGVFT